MPLDREGCFLAEITETSVCEAESGATSFYAKMNVIACFDNDKWVDWREYGIDTEGDFYLIKKDGTTMNNNIKDVMKATGWGGDLNKLDAGDFPNKTVMVHVRKDTYKDVTRFRPAFIRPADGPTTLGRQGASEDRIAAIQQQIGSSLLAIAPATPYKAPVLPALVKDEAPL